MAAEGGSSAGYHTLPDRGQNRFSAARRHVSAKRIYVRLRGTGASTGGGWGMEGEEWGGGSERGRSEGYLERGEMVGKE